MHAYTQKVASIEPRWSMHDHSCCSACVGSTSPPSSKFSRIKSKLFSRIETNLQLHEQQAKDHTHTILDLHALRPRISPRFLTRPQLSPLRSVRGTEHPPLARLECSWARHLPLFLELRVNPRHHAQRRNEAQSRKNLRSTTCWAGLSW